MFLNKNLIFIFIVSFFILFLLPFVFSLTPIARFDVVPYQRIDADETFNVGVIAFSKEGINRVEFTISGQGYSGTNPVIVTEMTKNTRTDVYEYWFTLSSSDFLTDGLIEIDAIVYGNDGDNRDLDSINLVVDATGNLAKPKVWVSNTGSDTTGLINNRNNPFLTIGAAVDAIENSNDGISDGSTVYLFEGTYTISDLNSAQLQEWLTITRDYSASKNNVIITRNDGEYFPIGQMLSIDGITMQSQGFNRPIFHDEHNDLVWINNSELIGAGRYVQLSSPATISGIESNYYSTNNYLHDVDYGYGIVKMVRGCTIENTGNDALSNTPFVVNTIVRGVHNGETGWHADGYQVHTTGVAPAENRIIYNLHATDLHISGLFARSDAGTAINNAFVNVFFEMRDPYSVDESGTPEFTSLDMYHNWDHLLFWHCSFPSSVSKLPPLSTNSSFVGNLFRQYTGLSEIGELNEIYLAPNNDANNEFLYNHMMHVYGITPTREPTLWETALSWPVPHWYAKLPDSSSEGSSTYGDVDILEMNYTFENFGYPLENSPLIDGVPFTKVPGDINNNPRDSTPDIGAFEYNDGSQNDDECLGLCTSSITQHGITWTFDKEYNYGQFINGDYWVTNNGEPVTIISIDPPSLSSASRQMNGAMINPTPLNSSMQGFDYSLGGIYDSHTGNGYRDDLNVALDVSLDNPLVMNTGSLVSSISIETAELRPQLELAAVLTILPEAAELGSFRPSYSGSDKTIKYHESDLDYSKLKNLVHVSEIPDFSEITSFDYVWLDFVPNWMEERIGHNRMPGYGREKARDHGVAMLKLNLNYSDSEKEVLLIKLVQLGIDLYGISQESTDVWINNGGHASGRLAAILFSGVILNDESMMNIRNNKDHWFGETDQSFYITQDDVDITNSGSWDPDERYGVLGIPYNESTIGIPEWGIEHRNRPNRNNFLWSATYRSSCGSVWAPQNLAIHIMNYTNLFQSSAYLDYTDRYYEISGTPQSAYNFITNMWTSYRTDYDCVWTRDDQNDNYSQGHYNCDDELIRCNWQQSNIGLEINSCLDYPNNQACNYDPCNLNCSGICESNSIHDADVNNDNVIDLTELNSYVNSWRSSNTVTLANLIEAIRIWKA